MDQATIEWLTDDVGNWIGCTKDGEVVYKNDEVKSNWEDDDRDIVLKTKDLIGIWAAARRYRTTIEEGSPKAFGGQAEKDKDLRVADGQVEYFKAKSEESLNKCYTTPIPQGL